MAKKTSPQKKITVVIADDQTLFREGIKDLLENEKNITVVGLTGRTGGKMKAMCDHCLSIPSDSTPRIQEGHLASYHLICGLIEETMFGDRKSKY